MDFMLENAIAHYRSLGAPRDQGALVGLLREVQQENNGAVPMAAVTAIAAALAVKDSFLLALIRRIPSLRLADTHVLEVCAGPNCGKAAALAAFAESLQSSKVTVRFVPCMRMCGKGPNIKWDGRLYHQANEQLLRELTKNHTD